MDLKDLRKDFGKLPFDEKQLGNDPPAAIKRWLVEALESGIPNANAMVLSTCSGGFPSSRVVLLKEINRQGALIFYTDYSSRKGKELAQNPNAALLFYWETLERQLRIEGHVAKVPAQVSDDYFNSRPLESRASAVVSLQSEPIESLNRLLRQREELLANGTNIKRPARWGGYALTPLRIEFWQGGAHRLHHRILFVLKNGSWEKTRLAP